MSDEHHHHGHDHHGHHHHGPVQKRGLAWRVALAVTFVLAALAAAMGFTVPSGQVAVVTRFGAPVRVQTTPGLGWKWPTPVERCVAIDCRMQSTAGPRQAVLTRDGLSLVVQAAASWRVAADAESALRFLRAAGNSPELAAEQLRSFLGSALETVAGGYALPDLVNSDSRALRLAAFEASLHERLASRLRETYGIELIDVGVVRLMLPDATLEATTARMAAERETAAAERRARGTQAAAEIASAADRDARIIRAQAEEEASALLAAARTEAAAIHGKVQALDPELYAFLRSLDTLEAVISNQTRLVLRTDAAPFRALVESPGAELP